MKKVAYYKLESRWYLAAPEYIDNGGHADDLECVGGFRDFLEMAAAGALNVEFVKDSEPFEGADKFELLGSSGGETGGYYRLSTFEGKQVDMELWLSTMDCLHEGRLPDTIYFKRITKG